MKRIASIFVTMMYVVTCVVLPGIPSVLADDPAEANISLQATATASSTYSGFSVNAIKDGVVSGYPNDATKEWASNGQTTGAWAQLTWGTAQAVTKVRLFDRPNLTEQVTSGTLTFSDGTSVNVGALPDNAATPAEVTFAAKTVTWVKFTVNSVKSGSTNIGLAEFEVYSGATPSPTPTPTPSPVGETNISSQATATASSTYSGFSVNAIKDGVVSGYPNDATKEWASNGQTTGAWAQLTWGTTQAVTKVRLFDRPNLTEQVTSGTLTFSDGTSVNVGALPDNAATPAEVTFAAKTVTWVKFTVNSVKSGSANIGLAEFEVYTGSGTPPSPTPSPSPAGETNISSQATATASSTYSGFSVNAIKDGVVSGYPVDSTKEWASNGQTTGAWAQLTWGTAQAVTKVRLFDRPNLSEQVTSGTLTFSDGTSVNVGALPDNAATPAEVTFAAKTVTWVKFTVNSVKSGSTNIGLAEFEVYTGTGTPPSPTPTPSSGQYDWVNAANYPVNRICVVQPAYTTNISGDTEIVICARGFTQLTAKCWKQGSGYGTNQTVATVNLDTRGVGGFMFPASQYPHGPITIVIKGTAGTLVDECNLQLYNTVGVSWNEGLSTAPTPPQINGLGLSVVYSDDFTNSNLSISKTDTSKKYTSHTLGYKDFSGIVFRDYEDATLNPFGQVDTYMRIRANQTINSSGLISSIHQNGSGFAVKAPAYFECKFIAQNAKGTWPAFWTLTNTTNSQFGNGACDELDCIEAYGFDSTQAEYSTLNWYTISTHNWNQTPAAHPTNWIHMNNFGGTGLWYEGFHTYGVLVTATDTVFYCDNIEVWRKVTTPVSAVDYNYFLINLAVGGNSGWPLDLSRYGGKADMYVDWVRAYGLPQNVQVN